jgi:hypothetical protein
MQDNLDFSKLDKTLVERGTEKVIESYLRRWNLKDTKVHVLKDSRKRREIGEVWQENGMWHKQMNGYVTTSHVKPVEGVSNTTRPTNLFKDKTCKCGKIVRNRTELKVFRSTNKCFDCHTKEETEKIARSENYVEPKWKNDIIIKDSFNQPSVSIDEYEKEFGKEEATKIIEAVHELKSKNKTLPEISQTE